jgi:hypothetical protein
MKYMETPETFFTPKNAKFCCDLCHFKCSKQSDWNRHIKTIKHIHSHNGNELEAPGNIFTPKNAEFICDCGRVYNSNSGLWKHKTKSKCVKTDNKNGTAINPYMKKRMDDLRDEINIHIKRIYNDENTELLELHYLFYDGYK